MHENVALVGPCANFSPLVRMHMHKILPTVNQTSRIIRDAERSERAKHRQICTHRLTYQAKQEGTRSTVKRPGEGFVRDVYDESVDGPVKEDALTLFADSLGSGGRIGQDMRCRDVTSPV